MIVAMLHNVISRCAVDCDAVVIVRSLIFITYTACSVVVSQHRQSELGRLSDIESIHNKGQLRCQFVINVPQSPRAKSSLAKASPRHLFMAKGKMENGNSLIQLLNLSVGFYVIAKVVVFRLSYIFHKFMSSFLRSTLNFS